MTRQSTPQERAKLREAYEELMRADYHLAVAARLISEAGRPGWGHEADRLMDKCIALREEIHGAEL